MSEWRFRRDTAFRKNFFVPDSFMHPAKMDAQLLIRIVEEYTSPGETILDPMAGSGTTMLACMLGRNVVLVELEEKFCMMCRDNWDQVRMLPMMGYKMGNCQIVQGDARQLEGLLADAIVTSPPYTDNPTGGGLNTKPPRKGTKDQYGRNPNSPSQRGLADKIITSPPYAETIAKAPQDWQPDYKYGQKDRKFGKGMTGDYSNLEGQIGKLPYGNIDSTVNCVISSPPYEGSGFGQSNKNVGNVVNLNQQVVSRNRPAKIAKGQKARQIKYADQVEGNLGNLQGQSYLEAMLQVYRSCFAVLKPQGLMVLVTKNFIRNQQVDRLDLDTIKLCGQAKFSLIERHYRKLPSQSFWRSIYYQKYPHVERLNFEDVLVFRKKAN